jgi:signal transduction histidine kinase
MSQGGIDYSPSPCRLRDLVGTALHVGQDIATNKNIFVQLQIPEEITVLADQPMIKTVIRNIVFNAIKFSYRGGEITIKARQHKQSVTIAIQDHGIGVDQKLLPSIFSLENAKRQTGTDGEKGTGLGLVLCKQFIEQHGGQIWVESEPGKGTTVYFTLPAA